LTRVVVRKEASGNASWTELLEEADRLEAVAVQIQRNEDIGLTPTEIQALGERYRHWYGTCLSLLPEHLRDPFRGEFQGSQRTSKIQAFLSEPTAISPLYQGERRPTPGVFPYWKHPFVQTFKAPLDRQRALIAEASAAAPTPTPAPPVEVVVTICRQFAHASRALRGRLHGRPNFEVENEYDVQDLLLALLRSHFDDVRLEEWTPTWAGAASRVDILVKAEQVMVETKMTRPGLTAAALRDELAIDVQAYATHPDCKALVILIHDPEHRIANPTGLEADLMAASAHMPVRAVVG
jgi:hypothetical protein